MFKSRFQLHSPCLRAGSFSSPRFPCVRPRFMLSLNKYIHQEKKVPLMSLQESGEMYLETILVLSQRTGFVRAIDIGEEMGYSKPSVSRAVGILRKGGCIHVAEDGGITLTESGRPWRKRSTSVIACSPAFWSNLALTKRPLRRTPAKWSMSSAMPPWKPSSATPWATSSKFTGRYGYARDQMSQMRRSLYRG